MLTCFLPVFVIALFVLAVFYQETDLEGRVANLATLVLAYVAFIPTVRSALLPVSYITFCDGVLGANFTACLICLLDSILTKAEVGNSLNWSLERQASINKGLFAVACSLVGLPLVALIIL